VAQEQQQRWKRGFGQHAEEKSVGTTEEEGDDDKEGLKKGWYNSRYLRMQKTPFLP
jgi:hypothetical protein